MSAEVVPLHAGTKQTWEKVEKNLFRYVPTGEIWVRKTFQGERLPPLRANTEQKTIGKARTAADILIAAWRAKFTSGTVQGRTIGDVIAEILRIVTPHRRVGTQEQHRIYLGELRKELGHIEVDKFTRATWVTWLDGFKARKRRATFVDYSKNLNLVLRYAYQNRMTSHLVTIPSPDTMKKKAGRLFSPEEIERLNAAALDTETRLQFALGYGCAMRLREALKLSWERIDLDTGLLTLRAEDVKTGSKTGHGRSFYVTQEALALLREQNRALAGRSPFVFPNPQDATRPQNQNKTAWSGMKARAGIKGRARFHDLRHSRITHLLFIHRLGIEFVSEYVGTSIVTLQRVYVHSTAENTRAVSQAPMIPTRVDNEKPVNTRSMEQNDEE